MAKRAKLDWEMVRAIRKEYAMKDVSAAALARSYKVCTETVRRIVRGEVWFEETGGLHAEDDAEAKLVYEPDPMKRPAHFDRMTEDEKYEWFKLNVKGR